MDGNLCRSTVSLLSKELKKHSNHSNKTAIVEELCAVFEAGTLAHSQGCYEAKQP